MLRADMSVGLRRNVVRGDNLDEDFFEIVFGILLAKLSKRAFRKEFSGLDDADSVAKLLDFAHHVGGKDDRLAPVSAFSNKGCDSARSQDRKSTRLNSSHPSISYAVFCLKKKNTVS